MKKRSQSPHSPFGGSGNATVDLPTGRPGAGVERVVVPAGANEEIVNLIIRQKTAQLAREAKRLSAVPKRL